MEKTRSRSRASYTEYLRHFPGWHPVDIELHMIKEGGAVIVLGKPVGNGLFYHYKQAMKLLWPKKVWHRWNNLMLEEFIENRITGVMGPANSGKTHEGACFGLVSYWAMPRGCTVLVSSTDSRSLELRIWGEMKKLIGEAMDVWDPPGRLISSRQMYVTSSLQEDPEEEAKPEDFRNGIVGIPCTQGSSFVGLGKYVGVKNDVILLLADEASLMQRAFFDAISNLNKNKGFKGVIFGNPKDPEDPLGLICEPAKRLGGYEGIEQGVKTQVWDCRLADTRAIQLVGTDSPNFDVPDGSIEPYPFLIGRQEIARDLEYYGSDNLHFQMMDLGVMPKNAQSRRVISRHLCEVNKAFEPAVWYDDKQTQVLGLDASYSSVGGDRTVLTHLAFGLGEDGKQDILAFKKPPILIPIRGNSGLTPEDQIALFVKTYLALERIPAENLGFDSTGRGTLASAFAKLVSVDVIPIEFGGQPSQRQVSETIREKACDYYGKWVSELWFATRHIIEAQQLRNMPTNTMEEGCMREWGMVGKNRVDVEPKELTKKRLGRSPDLYDSFVAAVEVARRRGFSIGKVSNRNPGQNFGEKLAKLRRDVAQFNASKRLQAQADGAMSSQR